MDIEIPLGSRSLFSFLVFVPCFRSLFWKKPLRSEERGTDFYLIAAATEVLHWLSGGSLCFWETPRRSSLRHTFSTSELSFVMFHHINSVQYST